LKAKQNNNINPTGEKKRNKSNSGRQRRASLKSLSVSRVLGNVEVLLDILVLISATSTRPESKNIIWTAPYQLKMPYPKKRIIVAGYDHKNSGYWLQQGRRGFKTSSS